MGTSVSLEAINKGPIHEGSVPINSMSCTSACDTEIFTTWVLTLKGRFPGVLNEKPTHDVNSIKSRHTTNSTRRETENIRLRVRMAHLQTSILPYIFGKLIEAGSFEPAS